MSPKRQVTVLSGTEQLRQLATTMPARLRRVDRRLWPPMTATVLVLATVLSVLTEIPVAFWLLATIKLLLAGCALWFFYECLRHLLIARSHH